MVIASRTPEGVPNRCPVCGNYLKIEPSRPTRDAPCPHCGHLLWFAAERPLTKRQSLIVCVLLQGTARLGPPDPATRAAIESVADVRQLESMAERLLTCSRWDELVANP